MKITGLDLRFVTLPYRAPIEWAGSSETGGEYLLVRLCTDEGPFGLAELADKPTWTGSTPRLTGQALRELFEPLLRGQDPLAPERLWPGVDRIPGWPNAKAALDVALVDLAARQAGLPLWKYLGGWTDEVPVCWLATRGPYEQRLAEIEAAIGAHGFRALKVKIGKDPAGDVAYVQRLRAALGADVQIAVDANSGYSAQDALWVAEGLRDAGVTLFEDPCPLPLGERTTEVLRRCAVPVLVDQPCSSLAQVQAYVAAGAPAVSIKLVRTGYRWAERIRQHCEETGVLTAVGLNAETGLGSLMSLHLHGAHRHFQSVPSENCFHLHLREDLLAEPLPVRDGKIRLPDAPGLGATLDEAVLARYGEAL
jgi:L-alanine-DL-glutamate epimerase-like enolase superfamily enzyme